MPQPPTAPFPTRSEATDTPETTALLLANFASLYQHEVTAEEDVHRTLPFFGTALGIVVGALAYAAGRLPKWPASMADRGSLAAILATTLVGLAIFEASWVLAWLSRAIARRDYQRLGPEPALRARLTELRDYYSQQGLRDSQLDRRLADEMSQVLLDSYTAITPVNRRLNRRRYRLRALASSHLVRSLIWALAATSVIFIADKVGILPKVVP